MNRFTFNRGVWVDGNSLPEWEWFQGEIFDDYIKRIGYNPSHNFVYGCDPRDSEVPCEIFSNAKEKTFIALLSPFQARAYWVFLPCFPSLMMFIRDYSSYFYNEDFQYRLNGLQKTLDELLERSSI